MIFFVRTFFSVAHCMLTNKIIIAETFSYGPEHGICKFYFNLFISKLKYFSICNKIRSVRRKNVKTVLLYDIL